MFAEVALAMTVAKDALYMGVASDALRIGSLGLAALLALTGALRALSAGGGVRHWPLLGYVACLFMPLVYSPEPFYVLYHVLSIASAVAIGMAVWGRGDAGRERARERLLSAAVTLLALTCLASLAVAILDPERAWERPVGDIRRFRGILSEPASIGATSALLLGLAWLHLRRWWLRWPMIAVALACLVLTGSRTPIAATLLTALALFAAYGRIRLVPAGAVAAAALAALALWATLDEPPDPAVVVPAAQRGGSFGNLSGRLELWERGIDALAERPLFGSGLTLGSSVLLGSAQGTLEGPVRYPELGAREAARYTLHNGYLQSLLDSGIVGFLFYASIVALGAWRVLRRDAGRRLAPVAFVLVYMPVANLAENTIHSVATLPGLLYWILVAYALSLPPLTAPRPATDAQALRPGAQTSSA